jgi:hypothetical protein
MIQRRVIVLMFLGAAAGSPSSLETPAQAQSPAPDFSNYPQTESFRAFLRSQTNAAEHLQRADLLAISAFPKGDGIALQYVVTEAGQESDRRNVFSWALQASHWRPLSEEELNNLRSAIHELPVESKSPPVERLVIVSFREGTNWVTRSYDSDALPKSMRQIYDVIGERFESRDILSRTLPPASDEGTIRERISAIIDETIKQGEGYTVEGVKFWTKMPPSTKDVQEIKSYGQKAVPILEEYLFSDVGREGNLALDILGRLGDSQIVEPLKRVIEQSTSPSRRDLALRWVTQAPLELALPIIRNAAETDRDPKVRALARDLLVQYSPNK